MSNLGQRIAEGAAKLVAWLGRILALVGAFEQLVINASHVSGVALAFCGCLLAGAQTFEGLALHFIDQVFAAVSGPEQRTEPPPPPKRTSRRKPGGGS